MGPGRLRHDTSSQVRVGIGCGQARSVKAWHGKAGIGQGINKIEGGGNTMELLKFTLHGTRPLIMHSPKGMLGAEKSPSRKHIPTAADEAEMGAYRLPDGGLCVPADAVRECILSGAMTFRYQRRSAKPFLAGAMLLMDEYFPLVTSDGEQIRDYEVYIKRVVVQRQGILRARPRINPPWSVVCAFEYNAFVFKTDEDFLALFKEAAETGGRVIGLLDHRIEKGGSFGGFIVGDTTILHE